eukprot:CAMPEP_0179222224 /NCGR_PEP_ID=MMETSP0797-20121207/6608_1 /TAXON_ID=47934 /ORGANISM="Dinophysis acuminata, Strain DAEP01" /LENGTH=55 /DNA_ID=CAMNT_0020929055 /DNA_START=130 /DNA_END=294 /DNA_ORIENTATION=-
MKTAQKLDSVVYQACCGERRLCSGRGLLQPPTSFAQSAESVQCQACCGSQRHTGT